MKFLFLLLLLFSQISYSAAPLGMKCPNGYRNDTLYGSSRTKNTEAYYNQVDQFQANSPDIIYGAECTPAEGIENRWDCETRIVTPDNCAVQDLDILDPPDSKNGCYLKNEDGTPNTSCNSRKECTVFSDGTSETINVKASRNCSNIGRGTDTNPDSMCSVGKLCDLSLTDGSGDFDCSITGSGELHCVSTSTGEQVFPNSPDGGDTGGGDTGGGDTGGGDTGGGDTGGGDTGNCGAGSHWDSTFQECQPDDCNAGFQMGAGGVCEPIPDPPTDPVDPPTDPVDPPTDPVDPPTDPVDPPTDPVDPPTDPVDPPTSGGGTGSGTGSGTIDGNGNVNVGVNVDVKFETGALEGKLDAIKDEIKKGNDCSTYPKDDTKRPLYCNDKETKLKNNVADRSYQESVTKYWERMEAAPLSKMFTGSFEMFRGSGSCPAIVIDLQDAVGKTISSTFHCDLIENIRPFLSVIMIIVFSIAGIRVIGSA